MEFSLKKRLPFYEKMCLKPVEDNVYAYSVFDEYVSKNKMTMFDQPNLNLFATNDELTIQDVCEKIDDLFSD